MKIFKYGTLLMMLLGGGFAIYELRQIAELKNDITSGMAPEEALAKLAANDKTGVVSKVVDAHFEGMARVEGMGDMQAAAESAASGNPDALNQLNQISAAMSGAAAMGGSVRAPAQTKSAPIYMPPAKAEPLAASTITVLGADEEIPEGAAVLIDEKTGERIVMKSKRVPKKKSVSERLGVKTPKALGSFSIESLIPKEVADALGLPQPGSLQWRKLKAYALMGGTLFFTAFLLVFAKRFTN